MLNICHIGYWAGRPGSGSLPRLKELAVKLSTELSFDRAAEILSHLVPGLGPMTIWQVTQEIGEILQQEGKEKRAAVFEDGEVSGEKEGGGILPRRRVSVRPIPPEQAFNRSSLV